MNQWFYLTLLTLLGVCANDTKLASLAKTLKMFTILYHVKIDNQ